MVFDYYSKARYKLHAFELYTATSYLFTVVSSGLGYYLSAESGVGWGGGPRFVMVGALKSTCFPDISKNYVEYDFIFCEG